MFKVLLIPALLLLACKSDGAASTPPGAATQPETPPADDVTPQTSEDNGEDASKPEESADPPAKPAAAAASKDVLATVEAQPNGKTFAELILATDLAKQLRSTDGAGFTVLVPTDDAFKSLPKGQVEKWKKNPAELERVLKYHIIPGTHDVGKLGNFRTAPTTLGKDVEVKVEESDVRVGGGKLTETDIKASNGYVHVIDKVLVPRK
jgi:uncharacterized surface protein with fasciclin (FAS1) repeats